MKRFIKKSAAFLIVPVVLFGVLGFFINPYYGNEKYQEKHEYFINNLSGFNTVVFGSSLSYRHIDPQLFDSLMADHSLSTFNLAIPAIGTPEIYYLYDKLLNDIGNDSITNVIFELKPLNLIADKNINARRNFYYFNVKYLLFVYKYILDGDYLEDRTKFYSAYTRSFFKKLTDISKYESIWTEGLDIDHPSLETNGYYSLDQQLRDTIEYPVLEERRSVFHKDTSVLNNRTALSCRYDSLENEKYLNETHLNKLLHIIKRSEKKGMHVFYLIPPRFKEYYELRALQGHLPEENIIDLSCVEQFPELYQAENSFDIIHLNEKGARYFTMYLAQLMNGKNL